MMYIKKILASGVLTLLVIAAVISDTGCKKQPKCGCDGDRLDTIDQGHAYISYNAEKNMAQFSPVTDPYSIFNFCNPQEFMGELTQLEQGQEVVVSGEYFYDCTWLMNNSNSGQYSPYKIYQIKVTAISSYDYGK
ncbi:MAG: hypothetical protein L0Y37_06825 [Bacteroidales bacterium]|nr:hypothetical protein [Bacteroidales bacterium]